jgi:hypothetical protein
VGAATDARGSEVAPWHAISADKVAQRQGITRMAWLHRAPFDAFGEVTSTELEG